MTGQQRSVSTLCGGDGATHTYAHVNSRAAEQQAAGVVVAASVCVQVAPTFHLYRNGQKVADMTGAKVDKLRALISEQLGGASEQN